MKNVFGVMFLLALSGCFLRPPMPKEYESPAPSSDMAALKFDFRSGLPISLGSVFSHSALTCGSPRENVRVLFRRARGNPLISDVNADKLIYIQSGNPVGIRGAVLPGMDVLCAVDASFSPRAGVTYFVRLSDTGPRSCKLELFEDPEHQKHSKDFSVLECPKQ